MNTVRLGIIGLGHIGQHHAADLTAGKVTSGELAAVASSDSTKRNQYLPAKGFATGEALITSGAVDAVIVATPHFQHTTLGIQALERGLHVMVEKPISAHKADAERLIAAHERRRDLSFAGMFQMRAEPRYLEIKGRLDRGEPGQVVRVSWIMTNWFRTQAYYSSGGWRATWKGEGGGVLLNQCLHNLDMLQWLVGMPSRVHGFCQFGRFHRIEVEDTFSAYLEYPNGASGMIVGSTGEAPGANRLEIVGTQGTLVLEHDQLSWIRNESDMQEFSRIAKVGFTKPASTREQISMVNAENPHAILLQNFLSSILRGEKLIAPGAEGIASVELANAILYSSLQGGAVDLPLDSAGFESRLKLLIAGSVFKKPGAPISNDDFANSFNR